MIMKMWRPTGLTIQGKNSEENNIECQDVVASYVKNGLSVIALADGARLKEYSLEGASIVAPAVCKFVANNFTKLYTEQDVYEAKKIILEDLVNRLSKRAKKYKVDIQEFASTLLFVAIKEDKQCIIGHIGDGIVCSNSNGEWNIISKEEQKNALNETDLVTGLNVYARMKIYREELNEATSFVLLSDGSEAAIDLNRISELSNTITNNNQNDSVTAIQNVIINEMKQKTDGDFGIIYLNKVSQVGIYDNLEYEEKESILEKHYTHLYNVEAAIEDASFIMKVLKTTNANVQYISKKSKVSLATCKKITTILNKANYLALDSDVFSLIKEEDING